MCLHFSVYSESRVYYIVTSWKHAARLLSDSLRWTSLMLTIPCFCAHESRVLCSYWLAHYWRHQHGAACGANGMVSHSYRHWAMVNHYNMQLPSIACHCSHWFGIHPQQQTRNCSRGKMIGLVNIFGRKAHVRCNLFWKPIVVVINISNMVARWISVDEQAWWNAPL